MMRRFLLMLLWTTQALQTASCAVGQSAATQASQPAELRVSGAPVPMRVLSQSPAETETALQIICLFRSEPANQLHGALLETNEKLGGLLDQIRKPELFRGELGETLLISAPGSRLRAKALLLIGLGEASSYTPARMELVGSIVYREAVRLGVLRPFFAPTILDGGVTKFTTGEVSEQVIAGFLRAARTQQLLGSAGAAAPSPIEELTYLAGAKYAAITKEGMDKAIAAAHP